MGKNNRDAKKLSRREREKLLHRRQMLDAALELFSEKGYHNVSMHEIAERAEFAIGTLYKFFKNKEDMYRALVMEKSTEIFGELSAPLSAEGDTLSVLEGYLVNRARIAVEIAPLLRLHMAIAQGLSFNINAEVEKEHRKFHDQHIAKLASVMKEGIRKRVLRDADPHSLAIALDGLARSFFLYSLTNPNRYPLETIAPTVLDLFLRGGLAKRKGRLSSAS
jgi:AcrR family transcriptional regulator